MSTADKLNALVQTKADIKQALIDKGQNPSDVFSTYADSIRAIDSGLKVDIPKGATFGFSAFNDGLPDNVIYHINNPDNFNSDSGNILYGVKIRNQSQDIYLKPYDTYRFLWEGSIGFTNAKSEYTITLDLTNHPDDIVSSAFYRFNPLAGELVQVTFQLLNSSFACRYFETFYGTGGDAYTRIKGLDYSNVYINSGNTVQANWINEIEVLNFGKHPDLTNCKDFQGAVRWGMDGSDFPFKNGKQSLIDSLITNSFDRAAAGYNTCTVALGSYTKGVLTEDEIAQITAKGYTIA